jgi:hypothetical protein
MTLEEALAIWNTQPVLGPQTYAAYEQLLNEPFDPNVQYPIIWIYLHYASLDKAEALLQRSDDRSSETYLQLNDYLQALKFVEHWNQSVFPLSVT